MPTVADIARFLDRFAPPELAAEWDNVGLLVGDAGAKVRRVMTCLTVTPVSAGEAVSQKADLIVSHHPVLFRPTRQLTTATSEGRMLLDLICAGAAVHSPHTAFDDTRGGINDLLAERLNLKDVQPLRPAGRAQPYKLVVFVPDADLARVQQAVFDAGAGRIGEYRECSFRTPGSGTFFGSEQTKPSVGQKGRREEVPEHRLEVLCPAARLSEIVAAMRQAHSYEEPAYDIYALHCEPGDLGAGRRGRLAKPTVLEAFARQVKRALHLRRVDVVGDAARSVEQVAIACGSGGDFLDDARRLGCEVLLTGEVRFHPSLAAQASGLALVLAGHYATERLGVEHLAELLTQAFPDLHVWASRQEQDPVRSL